MIIIRNRLTDQVLLEIDSLVRADLSKANLSRANLVGKNLSGSYIRGVNLTDADLEHADLSYADLIGANLTNVSLRGVNLTDADLEHANLTRADLRNADLRGADLTYADLRNADLQGADLRNTFGIYTIQLERDLIIAHASQIQIGCEKHSIVYWLEYYKEIGEKHRYTDKQIEIYGKTLELIKLLFTEYTSQSQIEVNDK